MATATFRFHGALCDFLPRKRRSEVFACACARAATLKNAIEALGVPHTEVARTTVNGASATLDRIVREDDAVEVFPWTSQAAPLRFLADAHLGGLARFLRMLGFDTIHHNAYRDDEVRRLASEEQRVVLTRDRELLKCRDIFFGCYVHERKAEAQLHEVAARYDLAARARPFTLCLICNVALEPASEAQVRAYAPEEVLARYSAFCRCPGCERIFWEGSHFARMRSALAPLIPSEGPMDASGNP